jgi:putative ABC transport system permease protein
MGAIMMRPRWRKVLFDLIGSRTRTLLVVASIGVGLFAVGLIINTYLIITQDMQTGYQAVNPANILVSTTAFDQNVVDRVRNINGVRQAEGVLSTTLRVRSQSGSWDPIDIQAIPDIKKKQIDLLRVTQGVWPPNDKEIVVDGYNLHKLPVGVGGTLEIELQSGKTRTMKLVGVVNDQTVGATGSGGFFLAPVQGYITFETLAWLELSDTMNTVYVTVNGDANDKVYLREVANRVSKAIEDSGRTVNSAATRAADDHPNRVYVQAIAAVLFVLGFLVMFLSTFLITNTLSALLNQQIHQIGVMKTIGAVRTQVAGIYMIQIFFFGLIAFFIAQPLASYTSYYLLTSFADAINIVLQGYRTIPQVALLQLGIALLVPQLAGFIPILQGTRITAVEALNGYNQSNPPSSQGWFNDQLRKFRRLPRPVLLSLRNTFRRRVRLALTLTTLTLGGAVFISTFNAQGSLASYVDQVGSYFLADVNVSLKQSSRVDQTIEAIKEVPGVKNVEAWAASQAEMVLPDGSVGERMSLLAPPAGSQLIKATTLEGRWLQEGDQNAVAVNERFREVFPEKKVGDTLRVKISGKEKDLTIVGFFQLAGKSGGYVAYTTYEFLSVQIHEVNRARTYRVTATGTGPLTLAQQEDLGRNIEQHLKDRGFEVAEIEAGQSLTATTANGLNILTGFLLIMALLTAIVGSIGLAGTMSMNVLERTREIGIIRAIGASDQAVVNLVMIEGVSIGVMSWVLGTLLALPITTLMSNAIINALFGADAKFIFNPIGIILWLVIVLVLSALASILPARGAANLTIREVLSYE